jgi:hypothetical protein
MNIDILLLNLLKRHYDNFQSKVIFVFCWESQVLFDATN